MNSNPPFRLGTFSAAGDRPFGAVVWQEKVISFNAMCVLCKELGLELIPFTSTLELLEDWSRNFAALKTAVQHLEQNPDHPIARSALFESQLRVLPPVNLPRQIFCAGANYRKHVVDIIVAQGGPHLENMTLQERREWGMKRMDDRAKNGKPFVFTKLPSSIIGAFDTVILPPETRQPDWELELGVIIGKPARRVKREQALEYVAGYSVVNDITSRDLVNRPDIPEMGMDWLSCKSSPSFLPMGPYVVPAEFVGNPQDLNILLKLNGSIMQDEATADMIFDVARIIEFISANVQLLPGDLICTGSPAGNGIHHKRLLTEGDVLEGTITNLGTQRNPCKFEVL
jgi:2,4-didehydro-3-deoxy-L-rhamnonate hydrolase